MPYLTPLRSAHVNLTTFSRMSCGLASATMRAVLMYCQEMDKEGTPLSDSMQGLRLFCRLDYGLHKLVMHSAFTPGCVELEAVANVGRMVQQWWVDVDEHIAAQTPAISKDEAARWHMTRETHYDMMAYCQGFQFLVAGWGRDFPRTPLHARHATSNGVENSFSQHRNQGANSNPDVKQVMATFCKQRVGKGLGVLRALVRPGKLSYALMGHEAENGLLGLDTDQAEGDQQQPQEQEEGGGFIVLDDPDTDAAAELPPPGRPNGCALDKTPSMEALRGTVTPVIPWCMETLVSHIMYTKGCSLCYNKEPHNQLILSSCMM